jgi:hypothetical protein
MFIQEKCGIYRVFRFEKFTLKAENRITIGSKKDKHYPKNVIFLKFVVFQGFPYRFEYHTTPNIVRQRIVYPRRNTITMRFFQICQCATNSTFRITATSEKIMIIQEKTRHGEVPCFNNLIFLYKTAAVINSDALADNQKWVTLVYNHSPIISRVGYNFLNKLHMLSRQILTIIKPF